MINADDLPHFKTNGQEYFDTAINDQRLLSYQAC